MSETMVERVARAIYGAHAFNDNHDSLNPGFDGLSRGWRGVMLDSARAAIEAMREPTEEMLKAGEESGIMDNDIFHIPKSYFEQLWGVMIDAALSPNKETDR